MLGSLFAVAALLCCVSAQSHAGYGPTFLPGRNPYSELEEAKNQVYNLGANDDILLNRLRNIMQKVNTVSKFRARLVGNILPNLKQQMKRQDGNLDQIENQLDNFRSLNDNVEELSTKVYSLLEDLKEIRETRKKIITDLAALDNEQIHQDTKISNLRRQVALQDKRLEEAEHDRIEVNEKNTQILESKVKAVIDVVNQEQAESATVTLTAYNRTATINFGNEYERLPTLVWTIIGGHLVDTEGYYDLESIKPAVVPVDVQKDQATIKLVDDSLGFKVASVTVRLTAFDIVNEEIEH